MIAILIAGLALFLGVHLVPAVPGARRGLVARWGEPRYKAIFSLVAAAGLVTLVAGYALGTPGPRLFASPPAARAGAPWLVVAAFILLAASHLRGHMRQRLQHPMVIGVILWAGVHLLANGDLRGTLLFASFLVWAVLDLVASLRRGPAPAFQPTWRHDAMAIVGGAVLALGVMTIHRTLFGVAAASFSM